MQKRFRLRSSVLREGRFPRTRGSSGSGLFRSLGGVLERLWSYFSSCFATKTSWSCLRSRSRLVSRTSNSLPRKLFESWHLCQAAEDRSHAKHFHTFRQDRHSAIGFLGRVCCGWLSAAVSWLHRFMFCSSRLRSSWAVVLASRLFFLHTFGQLPKRW